MTEVESRLKVIVKCGDDCGLRGVVHRVYRIGHVTEVHVKGCACFKCDRPFPQPKSKPRRTITEAATYKRNAQARCDHARGACEAEGMHTAWCDGTGNQAHHVAPSSQGGSDEFDNLRWLNAGCHARIHSSPYEAIALGLLWRVVPPRGDAA